MYQKSFCTNISTTLCDRYYYPILQMGYILCHGHRAHSGNIGISKTVCTLKAAGCSLSYLPPLCLSHVLGWSPRVSVAAPHSLLKGLGVQPLTLPCLVLAPSPPTTPGDCLFGVGGMQELEARA